MNLGLLLRKRVGERRHQDRSFRRGVPDHSDRRIPFEPIADDQHGDEKAERDQQHSETAGGTNDKSASDPDLDPVHPRRLLFRLREHSAGER